MPTHQQIDERSLGLARAVAEKIDQDPKLLEKVRSWVGARCEPASQEWQEILQKDWAEVRRVLLDPGHTGTRLRQSSPFVGILTPQERWSHFPRSRP